MSKRKETYSRVLLIAAHPDDPEFGCAGTIARWAAEGRNVTYCILTSGDKGSKDPSVRPGQLAFTREKEQRAAARKLGVQEVIFLRHPDGLLENTMSLRRELAGIIRMKRPHIVVTIDPWRHYQTHPDHRAAGQAALDAVYAAKEVNLFPEQLVGRIEPWRVKEAYLFWTENPDRWEDITSSIKRRIAAFLRHTSQVGKGAARHGKGIRKGAKETAKRSGLGYQYAEAFKVLKI